MSLVRLPHVHAVSPFIDRWRYLFLIRGTSLVWFFPRWRSSPKRHGNRTRQDSEKLYARTSVHSGQLSIVKVQLFVGTRLEHSREYEMSVFCRFTILLTKDCFLTICHFVFREIKLRRRHVKAFIQFRSFDWHYFWFTFVMGFERFLSELWHISRNKIYLYRELL